MSHPHVRRRSCVAATSGPYALQQQQQRSARRVKYLPFTENPCATGFVCHARTHYKYAHAHTPRMHTRRQTNTHTSHPLPIPGEFHPFRAIHPFHPLANGLCVRFGDVRAARFGAGVRACVRVCLPACLRWFVRVCYAQVRRFGNRNHLCEQTNTRTTSHTYKHKQIAAQQSQHSQQQRLERGFLCARVFAHTKNISHAHFRSVRPTGYSS